MTGTEIVRHTHIHKHTTTYTNIHTHTQTHTQTNSSENITPPRFCGGVINENLDSCIHNINMVVKNMILMSFQISNEKNIKILIHVFITNL